MDITTDTLPYAKAAIRDILYLYMDMVSSYGGFGHNLDTGGFSPLEFIDSKVICPPGNTYGLNEQLLHAGSGIAILCAISDCLDETETVSLGWPLIASASGAFKAGRFKGIPDVQEALRLAFSGSEHAFREQLAKVYQHHVASYFSELAAGLPLAPSGRP